MGGIMAQTTMSMRIDEELLDAVKEIAATNGISVTRFVTDLIEQVVNSETRPKKNPSEPQDPSAPPIEYSPDGGVPCYEWWKLPGLPPRRGQDPDTHVVGRTGFPSPRTPEEELQFRAVILAKQEERLAREKAERERREFEESVPDFNRLPLSERIEAYEGWYNSLSPETRERFGVLSLAEQRERARRKEGEGGEHG